MNLGVKDLSVARGGVTILTGISFELAAGQMLVLEGPNGVGKTSLLRVVAGLQPAAGGQVVFGRGPGSVAYAAHADAVKPSLTVSENLSFWAAIHGAGSIDPALEAMNLGALAHRPAQNLSAGQRRRLGLARLFLANLPIWALDEPTVSLDRASSALFAERLAAHLGKGGSALVASHIELGMATAERLDLARFRAGHITAGPARVGGGFDEAFL
ncbi:MAG: heme ABC exporter ATP-binding protein CcmA [Paracoccaceae bacterium]